jgi:nicotinate-nucleotide pyrophosphorylase (carboxylating)
MTALPDRATILEAVMPTLLAAQITIHGDPEAVGAARIVAQDEGILAGLVVAKEVFARLGVRMRPLIPEGAAIAPGTSVAEVGGAIAAMRGAVPVALAWLERCSAVATGTAPPAPDDPLDAWAAGLGSGLSRPAETRQAGPSFRLVIDGEEG